MQKIFIISKMAKRNNMHKTVIISKMVKQNQKNIMKITKVIKTSTK